MGKWFAVVVVVLAIGSAVPIVRHTWAPPVDISTNGHLIDEQLNDTMLESGIAFLLAQFMLAIFVWKSTGRPAEAPIKSFPGGAKVMIIAAVLFVGTEILSLGVLGQKAWGAVYFQQPGPDAMKVQVQAGQFAFYFRYPGPDGKFGPLHPEKIDEGNQNFFGIDQTGDPDSKDDIVTGEMAVPVGKEVQILMHSKDVGHSFYVRELRLQQDFVPGLDLSLHFTATKVGKYEILCTQLCGLGHYNMRAYLEVMSQADFDQWLKTKASEQ